MATVLRRRPARRNNGTKIVAQPVASFPGQPAGDLPLKASVVEDSNQPGAKPSSSSGSSSSHTGSGNEVNSTVSCLYEPKNCSVCACPATPCLCSTVFSAVKGVPWTEKLNAPGDTTSSSTSGSETNFKATSGWAQNESLFLAAAAALTALKGLVLALQRVSGRSWAEKALDAQANACMFWVQAAAHSVQPSNWKLGRIQDDDLKARFSAPSSQRDAFHDAEIVLALPTSEQHTDQRPERHEKRKRSTSQIMQSKAWLSFSPTLSSSPSGSSGFSFIQGDEMDGPSALERSTLETLVNNLMENPGSAVTSQPTTPDQVCTSSLIPDSSDKSANTSVNSSQEDAQSKLGKRPISPPGAGAVKPEKESVAMESIGEEEAPHRELKLTDDTEDCVKETLFPALAKKPAETLTRKQKKNMKKKNSKRPPSLTVTPRGNAERPPSAK